MKILAIIGARGGSKRVPKKNIKLLAGKPLIAYTIETALSCGFFDRVIVSTEDEEIAAVSKKFGAEVPFMRPKNLADGKVSRWAVLQHAVKYLGAKENYVPDIVVDLSPTSPLRQAGDIKAAINKLVSEKADIVTAVCESDRSPYFNMLELRNGKACLVKKPRQKITEGQKAPKVYSMNDSINAMRREALLKNNSVTSSKNLKFIVMPRERSIDIDEEFDFMIAECIIKGLLPN